eukprot:CAMPEP_0179902842 /NCGR_PEP_ID=MMETSP0982-20121206/40844_1 /TAXON_ID=483367 /ORGANISM="non described non described, Strain CCMP 2436" /LENGTH=55 /DNA_ID=CAMNT_0021802145 /DNA_START=1 /DNA_END=165 /DNA_ORIENTATION=-
MAEGAPSGTWLAYEVRDCHQSAVRAFSPRVAPLARPRPGSAPPEKQLHSGQHGGR